MLGKKQIFPLLIEDTVKVAGQLLHLLTRCLILSSGLKLPDKVSILVKIVNYWIIAQALNSFMHLKIFVDIHLEPAFHLFVVDFVFLASIFLLL